MSDTATTVTVRASLLFGTTTAMWIVRVVDSFTSASIAGHGIVPRTMYGLEGIPVAPFIHADFAHLAANTVPLLVLGGIILLRGAGEFVFVALLSLLASGGGVWLLGAPNTEHIGASGIVFGFFGYLLFRAAFDRRFSSILITIAVAAVYGASMMYSLVPRDEISWTGHLFGFLGGFLAARLRYARRTAGPAMLLR